MDPSTAALLSGLMQIVIILAIPLGGWWIRSHVKDQTAAADLEDAIQQSVGIARHMQGALTPVSPEVRQMNLSPSTAVAFQHVLDEAKSAMTRLGSSNDSVIRRIRAHFGLHALAMDTAEASATAAPLATTTVTSDLAAISSVSVTQSEPPPETVKAPPILVTTVGQTPPVKQ